MSHSIFPGQSSQTLGLSNASGTILHDLRGRIIACSATIEQILHRPLAQLVDRTLANLFVEAEDGAPIAPANDPVLQAIDTGVASVRVVSSCQGDIHLRLECHPLFQAGESIPYAASTHLQAIPKASKGDTSPPQKTSLDRQQKQDYSLINDLKAAIYEADARTWEITYVSPYTEQLLGYPSQRWLNEPNFWHQTVMHPEDRERVLRKIQEEIAAKRDYTVEYRAISGYGRTLWLRDIVHLVLDESGEPCTIRGLAFDITQRKQTLQALSATSGRLSEILESMSDAFYALDRQGCFTYVNRAAESVLRCHRQDVLGKNFWETYPQLRGSQLQHQCDRVLLEQVAANFEFCYRDREPPTPQTTYRCFEARVYPSHSGLSIYLHEITDRKRSEAALVQTNQMLQAIIDGTPDAIYVKDCQGQYLVANAAAANWLNLKAEQIYTCKDEDLFPLEMARRIQQLDARVRETGDTLVIEEEIVIAGHKRFTSASKYPWRDRDGQIVGTIGICRDLSDRRCMEEQLRRSEERFRLAMEFAAVGTWDWNLAKDTVIWNDQHFQLLGLTPGTVEPSYELWKTYIHPEDLEAVERELDTAIMFRTRYSIEYRILRPDGRERWLLGRGQTIGDDRGQAVRMLGIVIDISDRKQAEAERERLLTLEQAAREQAESANRSKDEFLAILSHELRTPLNPILGWSRLLQVRQFSPEKTQRALESIHRNAQLQVQLIEDLLDISRISRGLLALNVQTISPTQAVKSALETVRPSASAKAIELSAHLETVPTIRADGTRFEQIVLNLLSNAIKFTPEGGRVTLKLTWEMGTDSPLGVGQFLRLSVSDTGIGISNDFLPHVFELFRQQDRTVSRRFGGLGLGLALVKRLVEAHGGSVSATSAGEGLGSTFTVDFPVLSPPTTAAIASPNQPLDLQGIRVLVVDEQVDFHEFACFVLEPLGVQATPVSSARAATEAIARAGFDILVSDLAMPQTDGYALLRSLRQNGWNNPAIAVMAAAGEEEHYRAKAAGYSQLLAKPVAAETLIAAIASVAISPRQHFEGRTRNFPNLRSWPANPT